MSNHGTLDDLYLEWLYSKIGTLRNRNPNKSYWNLSKQLYQKPFRWIVPNDDNRGEDGRDLRYDFADSLGINRLDEEWMSLDCSVLEMLIALSERAAFESYGECGDWFRKFLENLGILQYTDSNYDEDAALDIDVAIERLLNREYERNGRGGLFPLIRARRDQRKVEIWYQMSSYLLEDDHIGRTSA